jgi:hypothetical protein
MRYCIVYTSILRRYLVITHQGQLNKNVNRRKCKPVNVNLTTVYTQSSTSASYLDVLLKLDTNGKITTQLYGKRDDFNFSIVNFPCLCSNIPASTAYGIYISQLIRYARACSTYDQFLVRGNLLTVKLMSQGFQLSRLQAAFRKFYGCYNDLICPYNLFLGHMLPDMFHTIR